MKIIKIVKSAILFLAIFLLSTYTFKTDVVLASDVESVYLGGYVSGFSINTKGATVVGVTEVLTEHGSVSPSKCAGIMVGDVIISLNGTPINSSKDIHNFLQTYKTGYVVVEIERCGAKTLLDVFPEKDALSNTYKLGIFIRDELSGLGTVTFIDESGVFASLGHQVSDERGELLTVVDGNSYDCTIVGVNRASKGKAGELKGMFIGESDTGIILKNTEVGLFGKLKDFSPENYKKISTQKAKVGSAYVYTTIDGQTPKAYQIEIVKTDFRDNFNKNLVVKVVDKELLTKTGGILQGMSGSPIIQDGKLVGAITHVFLNDSSRGYGISIFNMLEKLNTI